MLHEEGAIGYDISKKVTHCETVIGYCNNYDCMEHLLSHCA